MLVSGSIILDPRAHTKHESNMGHAGPCGPSRSAVTDYSPTPSLGPLCGSKRELGTRFLNEPHNGLGAPQARPPERSGATGPRERRRGGSAGAKPPGSDLTVGAKLWNVCGATTMLDAHAAFVTQAIGFGWIATRDAPSP